MWREKMQKRPCCVSRYSAVVLILLAVLSGPVFAEMETLQEVTLTTSVNSEKVNVWLPATLTIHKGDKVNLTLKNSGTKDHGFAIDALHLQEIIPLDQSKEVTIEVTETGTFPYYCPLHPGHVGGQLVVQ
jgi:nitrosocyanin